LKFIDTLEKKPNGLFVFIDDDEDEHFLLKLAMKELGLENKTVHLKDGLEAFRYLRETTEDIFIILCDLNMPKMDGLELKRLIEITPELKIKVIPFIFHSSTGSSVEIKAAYAANIQAFMQKAPTLEGTVSTLGKIISLWTSVIHPKDLSLNGL
jgi:CheY-like chemotaxis protein